MILKAYNNTLSNTDLNKIVRILQSGGVIIYPTDSVYAFACDASNKNAVEQICRLRHKDVKRPELSLVCSSISQVRSFALFSDDTFKLMRAYLPGPVTFILQGNSKLPKLFKIRKTLGIRIPDHPVVSQIVDNYADPLMTASLRVDDNDDVEYMTDPELMYEKYADEVDLIIDAGIGGTQASKVIDCTGDEPIIIRE